MLDQTQSRLPDGRTMHLDVITYPPSDDAQRTLTSLWLTEWSKTDYDWEPSLRGDYSDTLCIRSVIASIDGIPAATATVNSPVQDPEVAVVGSVLTQQDFRRLGVARQLTDLVTDLAFADGCRVALLGNEQTDDNNVYVKCGYERYSGCVLRRPRAACDECEKEFFAPGQAVTVRPSAWGDLPGFSCLVAQPLNCWVIDYPRSYLSAKHARPLRCVSMFPHVYDDVTAHGGAVTMLIGEAAHRVLGFGSLTPGPRPGRDHAAVIDVAAHDHYVDRMPELIERLTQDGRRLNIESILAFVAERDQTKTKCLMDAGFTAAGSLARNLHINGQQLDVTILCKQT